MHRKKERKSEKKEKVKKSFGFGFLKGLRCEEEEDREERQGQAICKNLSDASFFFFFIRIETG